MKHFTIALLVGLFALGPHAFGAASPTTPINNARLTGNATVSSGATLTIESGGTIVAASGSTVTGFGGGGGGSGNVTSSGTPTSGQTAEFTTATNIVGVATTGTGSYVKASSPTLVTPTLGTPASATLTNATGLPISTGVSGLGTGVATFLATPSSANLASAVTDETGSGGLVFATSPTFVTNFTLASGAAPTTSAVAQMAFDTNAWATSFGAVQVHNGTAVTYLVGIEATDTPTNGQVPVWNTGGTITWQDQSGSGGAPTDATYIVQTSNGSLSAEQVLASLSTGIMRVATTTGVITSLTDSAGIATNISDETGTGVMVFATSPTFTTNLTLATSTTPTTGAAGAIAFDTDAWGASRGAPQVHDGTANIVLLGTLASDTPTNGQVPVWNTGGTITWEAAGSGNVTNNATLASGNMVIGGGTTVVGTTNATWTAATNTFTTGNLAVTSNATFGNLTTTNLTISGTITGTVGTANGGLGADNSAASGIPVFAAGTATVDSTPDLGTPSAITLTNGTGLPISTGVSGLGTGVATALATPSSANFRSAVTDEVGAGPMMFTRTGVVREIWIPAGAMTPAAVNGAATGSYAPAGADGQTTDVFAFDDTTAEYVQWTIAMPAAWNLGTVKMKFYWTSTSGTGNVEWGVAAGALSDDDAMGAVLGTPVETSDAVTASNDMMISAASGAVTVGNTPALDDMVLFRAYRDPSVGTNKTGDALLIGVKLQYTESTIEPTAW